MATFSSHVLDSVTGNHARNIRVRCIALSDGRELFDVTTNESGRIVQTIDVAEHGHGIELVFHTADYFAALGVSNMGVSDMDVSNCTLSEVVVRLNLHEADAQYHAPLVLSPHSYTLWWSGLSA